MDRVLIATLGAEPQVVSLATTLLCRSAPLCRVVVLHTNPAIAPIARALPLLTAFFAARETLPPLDTVTIPADDVLTPGELTIYADTLLQTLKRWRRPAVAINLLLAGGRKPMAMLGMTVAQMLFGPEDQVWYLTSDEALRRSGRMTPEPADRAGLVAIPLAQMGPASPRFTQPLRAETVAAARRELAERHAAQLIHFAQEELTPAERMVAALVANDVMTVAEMADRLHKSPKTVSNQLNSIYSKLESRFDLQPDKGVKREFLRRELAPYFRG